MWKVTNPLTIYHHSITRRTLRVGQWVWIGEFNRRGQLVPRRLRVTEHDYFTRRHPEVSKGYACYVWVDGSGIGHSASLGQELYLSKSEVYRNHSAIPAPMYPLRRLNRRR